MNWKVCPDCHGEGYKSKLGAMTGEDLDRDFGPPGSEEREEFLNEYTRRGGAYDEPCSFCNGERVVSASRLGEWEAELEYRADMAAEMRMMEGGLI